MPNKAIQYRATCPVCFRNHAVKGAAMVQHGYERPQGWHQNVNACMGVNAPHFGTPEGREVTRRVAVSIRAYAASQRELAAKVERREVPIRRTWGKQEIIENPMKHEIESYAGRFHSAARQAEGDADYMDKCVAEWQPAEPKAVEVEKKAPPVHFAMRGKLCASGFSQSRHSGAMVTDWEKVTCTRCLSRRAWAERQAAKKAV